jgi:uncharacterized protein YndB with AHSA1/START domain
MNDQTLEIKTSIQILKPCNEVFEAIVNPDKMKHYFIAESTGRMEEGKELVWRFPEFDMNVPIRVGLIKQDEYISYYWCMNEIEHIVEMYITSYQEKNTILTITEKGRENNDAGIKWLQGNTEGWANFLASLKAFLEYGINLRKGAFEYRRTTTNLN